MVKQRATGATVLVTIGRGSVVLGTTAVVVGVVVGFVLLAAGAREWALRLLLLAPIGMIMVFAGLTGALLGGEPVQPRGPEDG
jgi:hypothetical protein